MTTQDRAQPFDPVEFKQKTRQEWQDAAAGWRKWHHKRRKEMKRRAVLLLKTMAAALVVASGVAPAPRRPDRERAAGDHR